MAEERVWLVTGSSSGFGREIARAALAAGNTVVATARRPEVPELDDRAHQLALDVTDPDAIHTAVGETLDRFGRIDVLVNNAGFGSVGAVEELTMEELRAACEVMFFGAVELTKAVLPHMRERRSGTIVQMSSQGGQVSPPGFGAYCAAKFALEAISVALADEVAPFGVRVLIVEPGSFRTSLAGRSMKRSRIIDDYGETSGRTRAFVDDMDGKQPGDPAKAARAILRAVDADDAPLRLALGADAVEALRAEHRRRARDLDAWEAVSVDTAIANAAWG
jgi:NAD(P)-dependent dehydrogenase (short-subunit alcohol dehydrogenase family)